MVAVAAPYFLRICVILVDSFSFSVYPSIRAIFCEQRTVYYATAASIYNYPYLSLYIRMHYEDDENWGS